MQKLTLFVWWILVAITTSPSLAQKASIKCTSTISSYDLSSDGTLILTGSKDKTVKLWEMKTGMLLKTYPKYKSEILSVRFSPDGKTFFVTIPRFAGNSVLCDVKTGRIIQEVKHQWMYSRGAYVAYSLNSSLMITSNGVLDILNKSQMNKDFFLYQSAAFSPDNKQIVTDGGEGKVALLWDIKTGDLVNGFVGHKDDISAVQFSINGSKVFTGSLDHTVKVWDARLGALLKTLKGHTQSIQEILCTQDSSQILSVSENEIIFWNLSTGQPSQVFKMEHSVIRRVVLTLEGARVLTVKKGHKQGEIWGLDSGKLKRLQTISWL